MPDIPNKEKQEIRILAEDFSCLIATLSFKKALISSMKFSSLSIVDQLDGDIV
ncbi:MAG: hypothetical protein GPJ51_09305 [Candidatus Heimdallarchaeota archaeon]|nr:hypothetical protein [Candidatus Heimdallarchaeota archaeon]